MTSQHKIVEYINRSVSLTEQESDIFGTSFREVTIKKRQFIVQPNFVVKNRNFVIKGAFRAFG